MQKQNFVEISQVTLVAPGAKPYTILDGVDLQVGEGEFMSLIGHSGCGKSTLVNLVAGLVRPTSGAVIVGGREATEPGLDRAMVFQSHGLLPWMSVEDNVRLALDSTMAGRPKKERQEEARRFIEKVGLAAHRHKKPMQLSGGMRQRVGIARAFATRPKVLLMDEPFGALDALTRGSMQDELTLLWEEDKKTVMMITHDVDEAIFLSDRIALFTNGPAARIAKVLEVGIPRPRRRETFFEHPRYLELKRELLQYLFGSHALAA